MSNDRSETSIRAFLTPPHACAYLEGEQARSLFLDPETRVSAALYQGLTERGFRRSGDAVYRPHCDRCSACQPSRLAIA
ncbi:MAG: arginyltransferase, partial [Pseudomonadota bacterium]